MCGGGDAEVKETKEQKELAKIAMERYQKYKEFYVPAENEYMNYVTEQVNSDQRQAAIEGASVGASESAATQALQQDIGRLTTQGTGVNPDSGAFKTAINENAVDRGDSRVNNSQRSLQALEDAEMAGMQNIVAMGNNQQGAAVQGFGDVASLSASYARNEAVSDFNESMGREDLAGTVAGAGYGAYKNREELSQ